MSERRANGAILTSLTGVIGDADGGVEEAMGVGAAASQEGPGKKKMQGAQEKRG